MRKLVLLLSLIIFASCQKDYYLDDLNKAEATIDRLRQDSTNLNQRIGELQAQNSSLTSDLRNAQQVERMLEDVQQDYDAALISLEEAESILDEIQTQLDHIYFTVDNWLQDASGRYSFRVSRRGQTLGYMAYEISTNGIRVFTSNTGSCYTEYEVDPSVIEGSTSYFIEASVDDLGMIVYGLPGELYGSHGDVTAFVYFTILDFNRVQLLHSIRVYKGDELVYSASGNIGGPSDFNVCGVSANLDSSTPIIASVNETSVVNDFFTKTYDQLGNEIDVYDSVDLLGETFILRNEWDHTSPGACCIDYSYRNFRTVINGFHMDMGIDYGDDGEVKRVYISNPNKQNADGDTEYVGSWGEFFYDLYDDDYDFEQAIIIHLQNNINATE